MSASNTLGNNAFFNRLDANNVNFKNNSDYNELLQKIETNTENIAINESDIATNTSNIATNTSNISTNTTDIATNTSDLSKINDLLEFDTVNKRVNPAALFNNGEISLGYINSTTDRARFDEIHCKDTIVNTCQVNQDIRFYSDGEKVRLDATTSEINGGSLDIYTKTQNGSLEKKMNISNRGALGFGTSSSYGTPGQILTSNGSNNAVSWESDLNVDEIDCRVLRVSETVDVDGRLANKGTASFVNDEFIFQNGVSNLGDTLYIDNVNNAIGINGENYGTSGQVLTSGGSGSAVSWTTPSGGGGGISSFATFQYLSTGTGTPPYDMGLLSTTGTAVRLTYDTEKINQGSNITLDTTTNNGRIGFGETGYYLITTYYVGNSTETGGARHILKCQIRKNGTDYGGTDHYTYNRNSSSGENTASVSVYVNIGNTSDYIEVFASEEDGTGKGYIDIKGTGITITKIA